MTEVEKTNLEMVQTETTETVKASPKKKPGPKKRAVLSPESSALKKKIAELEAKIAAGEEAALDRVCKALKIDPNTIQEIPAKSVQEEPKIRCFVPSKVGINGRTYLGLVEVTKATFEVIQQALGDRRMRLIRELTGNNYILKELEGGGYAPQLIGQVSLDGERIA